MFYRTILKFFTVGLLKKVRSVSKKSDMLGRVNPLLRFHVESEGNDDKALLKGLHGFFISKVFFSFRSKPLKKSVSIFECHLFRRRGRIIVSQKQYSLSS